MAHSSVQYVCYGFVSGFTKCTFKGEHKDIKRYKFDLPKKGLPKVLSSYSFRADYPKTKFEPLKTKRDDDSSQDGESSEAEEKPKKKKGKKEATKAAAAPVASSSVAGQELAGMKIAVQGTKADLGFTAKQLKEMVEDHGGTLVTKVAKDTDALVASVKETEKKKAVVKVAAAREHQVGIVTIDWLLKVCNELTDDDAKDTEMSAAAAKKKKTATKKAAPEGEKVYTLEEGAKELHPDKMVLGGGGEGGEGRGIKRTESESVSRFREQPVPGSGTTRKFESLLSYSILTFLSNPNRIEIDILKLPDMYSGSGGEILVTHDKEYGYTPYNAVLNLVDVAEGTNKFYKMAIIKKSAKRFVFAFSWGRIGSDKGGEKEHDYGSQENAIAAFVEKYEKFCLFRWDKRYRFKKQPGGYQWAQLDDGLEALKNAKPTKMAKKSATTNVAVAAVSGGSAKLDQRVRDFLGLIFDQEMMTSTLLKFNIDLKKMPLGKITNAQVLSGYHVLSDISDYLADCSTNGQPPSSGKLADYANQFYTLIPHDFGDSKPPLIDTLEAVKLKLELVEALVEIGDAVEIMQEETVDPLISQYAGLRSTLEPLDRSSERFKMLVKYMEEGHDTEWFGQFGVKVKDIFEIRRADEDLSHIAPYKDIGNRQLLWHGSRLSNWAGILSKGLRIAPPEAPKTGYRLGKGIYLADTISKSGSYCFTDAQNPIGVMMLAESALGRQWTTKKDKFMEKPQKNTDSTWAYGMKQPDPKHTVEIESMYDGLGPVAVPCGPPIKSKHTESNFSHDELVVYDVRQVSMRYIFTVEFQHGKRSRW